MSFIAKLEKVGFVTLGKQEAREREPWPLLLFLLTLGHGFSNENTVVITRTVTLGASGPRAFSVPHPHRSLCRRI